MSTIFRISQILIFIFTYPLLVLAESSTLHEKRVAEANAELPKVYFETLAEQLRTGATARDLIEPMSKKFASAEDAKFFANFANQKVDLRDVQVEPTGLTVTTRNRRKISTRMSEGKIFLNEKWIDVQSSTTARQFFARVEAALVATHVSKSDLLVPKAQALGPLPLLAGAAIVYAGSEVYSKISPYKFDAFLADLTKTCEKERLMKRHFEGSKSERASKHLASKSRIDEKTFPPSAACEQSGELTNTCRASQNYFSCLRSYKLEDAVGAAKPSKANPSATSR